MLEIISARGPQNVEAMISPKKRKNGDRVIQGITNLSETLRALISPAKNSFKAAKTAEGRLLPKRLFADVTVKENFPDIPLTQPDIIGQPQCDTSDESKGEPQEVSSETSCFPVPVKIPAQADRPAPVALDHKHLLEELKKAQNLLGDLVGAYKDAIANDPLMHYWHANPWSGTDFIAFDNYNDTHDTEASFNEFIAKKQKLEIYHKARQHIHWKFCRDFVASFNGSAKQFDCLLDIIRGDRYLNLDYITFARRLAHPALTEEEFSSITLEMLKEVSRHIYVEDLVDPTEISFFKK